MALNLVSVNKTRKETVSLKSRLFSSLGGNAESAEDAATVKAVSAVPLPDLKKALEASTGSPDFGERIARILVLDPEEFPEEIGALVAMAQSYFKAQ